MEGWVDLAYGSCGSTLNMDLMGSLVSTRDPSIHDCVRRIYQEFHISVHTGSVKSGKAKAIDGTEQYSRPLGLFCMRIKNSNVQEIDKRCLAMLFSCCYLQFHVQQSCMSGRGLSVTSFYCLQFWISNCWSHITTHLALVSCSSYWGDLL